MAKNVGLEYLDLVWRDRNPNKGSCFPTLNKFDAPIQAQNCHTPLRKSSRSSEFVCDAPSNEILTIHVILEAIQNAEQELDADFFKPFVLHYWQLQRLLDVLRCSTPVLGLPAQLKSYDAKLQKLAQAKNDETCPAKIEVMQQEYLKLEAAKNELEKNYQDAEEALFNGQSPEDKDNIQLVLIISLILELSLRQGMSVALLSEQLRLKEQKNACLKLLRNCGITFDARFKKTFQEYPCVRTKETVLNRISTELNTDMNWFLGREAGTRPSFYVSRVLGTQEFHSFYNHFRLGVTRFRRLLSFLESYLKNESYSAGFKMLDPYMRGLLAYVNWVFFIPRLSLNLSLLAYHGFAPEGLEKKLDLSVRLRAHWTRFWFEVIPDLYWILFGLKVCFWMPEGVLSPAGITLSVTVQALDLVISLLRAGIELMRLNTMFNDLKRVNSSMEIQNQIEKRFWFEAQALGYMVAHFGILMISLCLTLPSMTAANLLWPVLGGLTAFVMTLVSHSMQNYFHHRRQTEFEQLPGPDTTDMPAPNSRIFQ